MDVVVTTAFVPEGDGGKPGPSKVRKFRKIETNERILNATNVITSS